MRFFSLFIIVFILVSVPTFVTGQEIFKEANDRFTTATLTDKIDIGSKKHLLIRSAASMHGYISITTDNSSEVRIEYKKKAKTTIRSRAFDYVDLIDATLERAPDGARLELKAPNPAPWSENDDAGFIEIEVIVPEHITIDIDAEAYDVDATGPLSGIRIEKSYGRIDISDVDGPVEVSTSNRRVSVEKVTGTVDITTENSSIEARDIKSMGGTSHFENESGDILIDGFIGNLNVRNSFGRIEIERFEAHGETNLIRGSSEPITIELLNVDDVQLAVSNHYEDIDISVPNKIEASFSLSIEEDGKIEVMNFPFTADLVRKDRLNLTAGDGSSLIRASVRGKGNIYLRGLDNGE